MKNIQKRLLSVTVAALTAFSLMAAPVSAAGWHHNGDSHHATSSWSYHHEDGRQACNEWVCDGNKWYWFNEDGHMCTGWQSIDGCWYYLNDSGEMATGWKCLDGCWYYLNSSGEMATGWKQIGNTWYYLQSSGKMKTGWLELNGDWYYFDGSGAMVTGKKTIDGKTYTFSSNGVLNDNTSGSSGSSSGQTTTAPAGEKQVVFWGKTGTKYHIDPHCRSFKGTATNSGTLAQAKAAGREDWCGICSKSWTDEKLMQQGNPNVK